MVSLTDGQLGCVMEAARVLDVEKRDTYLQRVAALLLRQSGRRPSDADVAAAVEMALRGLLMSAA
jgi:hypothetical protein